MPNNVTVSPASGGATITAVDLAGAPFSYPASGETCACVIYVGPNTSAAPTPLSNANPLPVSLQNATLAVTQSGTWTEASNADTVIGGITAPAKGLLVVGKTSDVTPAYDALPLSNGGAAVKVDGSAVTQPISATSLPLPTGAAADASVTAMSGKLPATLGQHLSAASMSVVIASDQSAVPVSIGGTVTVSGTVTSNQGGAPWSMVGNIGSGTADSGNPVKVGGVFNSAAPTFLTGQRGDLQLDANGNLKAILQNASIAVTGTFWQATQPVSLASLPALPAGGNLIGQFEMSDGTNVLGTALHPVQVSLANTAANATAVKIDGSAVTQPISAASLPLPTGAAADATLTGGSAKAIVRGGQKGTTNANADITHTASGLNHEAIDVAIYDANGNQLGIAATPLRVDPTGTTPQPVSGTVAATQSGGWTVTANYGTGTFIVGQPTASSLNAQVQGAAASGAAKSGNPVQGGAVFNTTQPTVTTGQAVEMQATARGGLIVATGADTFSVAVGAALPAGTNQIGHVVNDAGTAVIGATVPSAATGSASVGATPYSLISAATNNLQTIQAGATTLWNLVAVNIATSVRYLKLFNGSPTMGTTNAVFQVPLPTAGSANGGGAAMSFPVGLSFASGLYIAITGGEALNDNTVIAANDVALSLAYK